MTIIILLSSLTVFWAKFYHKPPFLLFACLPKRILKKILEKRKSALLCIFGFSLDIGGGNKKHLSDCHRERQKISNSLSLSFFSVKSLLCCVHTTKSTEEEDGRDDEEEHCEKQRRH